MFAGPSRAVTVLAVTQILTWGILIYPPVLTMPVLTAAHGWSLTFGMAGFSLGLIPSGLLSPTVCGWIDRHGGSRPMGAGAIAGAAGLAGMAFADQPLSYFACWVLLGTAMSASLYDAAFATLTTVFGATARRQITFVTFAGGFASTVGWPATHLLLAELGWRGTYLVFAAIFLLVIAPLHFFALPPARHHAANLISPAKPDHAPALLTSDGKPFLLLAAAFAIYAFVLSGLTSNLLAMLQRGGLSATSVVAIGALFGPAQVAARLADFVLARHTNPLWIARGAVAVVAFGLATLALSGMSWPLAAAFALSFGAANGVITIARGALPLLLFGPVGYGRVLGRIARPALIVQALAPFVVASVIERFSDQAALLGGVLACVVVLACFLALHAPRRVHPK